jgi:hypothetical protein
MDIFSSIKIEEIYRYKLNSLVDISKYLDTWDNLSEDEKSEIKILDKPLFEKKYSHLSKQELLERSKDDSFWEEYNDKFVYGEISKEGVNKLSNYLKRYSGNFYDIGSGNGKLLLHVSLLTNFEKYVGVEIVELRHKYALKINEKIGQNVTFICDDVLNLDISDANFIFLDDLMFPRDLRTKILKKIPHNCLYISVWKNDEDEIIENLKIAVNWLEKEMDFYLYKKR